MSFKFQVSSFKNKGVAALVTMLSLGTLIFIISLSTVVLTFWSIQNIGASHAGLKTYYVAYSGVQDALIKLERNKDFSGDFNLSINSTNDVSVSVSNTSSQAIITAIATYRLINKKLQTIVNIDTNTGLIIPASTEELTL
jgi:hypothetical protein